MVDSVFRCRLWPAGPQNNRNFRITREMNESFRIWFSSAIGGEADVSTPGTPMPEQARENPARPKRKDEYKFIKVTVHRLNGDKVIFDLHRLLWPRVREVKKLVSDHYGLRHPDDVFVCKLGEYEKVSEKERLKKMAAELLRSRWTIASYSLQSKI